MSSMDTANALIFWTPYLAEGYVLNLLISVISMLLGTLFGWELGIMRNNSRRPLQATAGAMTLLLRNIPSFVFLFYIAYITPLEFILGDEVYAIPAWSKAVVALTIPVIGFVSDQVELMLRGRQNPTSEAFFVFTVAWTQYFLIILMASSTASVIGVNEIVGRADKIASMNQPLTLWIYGYAILWFLLSGLIIKWSLWIASILFHKKLATADSRP